MPALDFAPFFPESPGHDGIDLLFRRLARPGPRTYVVLRYKTVRNPDSGLLEIRFDAKDDALVPGLTDRLQLGDSYLEIMRIHVPELGRHQVEPPFRISQDSTLNDSHPNFLPVDYLGGAFPPPHTAQSSRKRIRDRETGDGNTINVLDLGFKTVSRDGVELINCYLRFQRGIGLIRMGCRIVSTWYAFKRVGESFVPAPQPIVRTLHQIASGLGLLTSTKRVLRRRDKADALLHLTITSSPETQLLAVGGSDHFPKVFRTPTQGGAIKAIELLQLSAWGAGYAGPQAFSIATRTIDLRHGSAIVGKWTAKSAAAGISRELTVMAGIKANIPWYDILGNRPRPDVGFLWLSIEDAEKNRRVELAFSLHEAFGIVGMGQRNSDGTTFHWDIEGEPQPAD